MPMALISGPAIPDIFLSLIALYFLIYSIISKNWSYYINPIFIGFIFFCIYGIVRSLLSQSPSLSLSHGGSVFYFRYIFFATGLCFLLEKNKFLIRCLLSSILLCLIVVIIDGIYQYIVGVNLFGNEKYSPTRLTGLFGDEPIIGRYISYLSIFATYLYFQITKVDPNKIILAILLLIISFVTIMLSGERSPLFNISLFFVMIILFSYSFRKFFIIGFFLSLFFISLIVYLSPISKERILNDSFNQISETHLPFLPYSELHEQHYIGALKMFVDKPYFGIGTNLFSFECEKEKYKYKDNSCTSHPHHFYIQLLAEQGIIGFLFLFSFFIYLSLIILKQLSFILFKSKNNRAIDFKNFLIVIILFIDIWPLIPHMSFYNNWNNIFIMMALGFFIKFKYNEDKSKKIF